MLETLRVSCTLQAVEPQQNPIKVNIQNVCKWRISQPVARQKIPHSQFPSSSFENVNMQNGIIFSDFMNIICYRPQIVTKGVKKLNGTVDEDDDDEDDEEDDEDDEEEDDEDDGAMLKSAKAKLEFDDDEDDEGKSRTFKV